MSDPRLTDTDPRISDPRDYRRTDLDAVDSGTNALWGWVAAALFVAAVLLFVFASGSGDRETANNGVTLPPTTSAPHLPPTTGSATTGSATTGAVRTPAVPATPAPAPAAPAPAAPGGANR
jgi:hypothetical protein